MFSRISKNLQNFQNLCEVPLAQFQKNDSHWNQFIESKKVSGRPSLSLKDELFMLLIYYRADFTMEWLGIFFHLDKAKVERHFQRFEPLVAIKKDRTLRQKQAETWIINATEIPVQTPKRTENKRKPTRGKKRHTLKVEVMINQETRKIVSVSKVCPGAVHNFKAMPFLDRR